MREQKRKIRKEATKKEAKQKCGDVRAFESWPMK
jgi:hypothetical protein